jgi:hemerythrin-like domain-containing protein
MNLLNSSPAVGFEQPYEMLGACHDRVERSLALLLRLAAHLQTQGADSQARDAARDVLRYFDIAAPHHHEDEERHVVPRLRALGEAALAELLLQEHRDMQAAYQRLRPGLLALRDAAELPDTADWPAFATLYRAHIELEETRIYPATRDGLSATQLAAMGEEMAGRRRV